MSWRVGQVYELGPLKFQLVKVYFTLGNTSYSVGHKLNTGDVGWLVAGKDISCDIFEAPLPRSLNSITLRSTATGVTAKILFVASNLSER